MAKVHENFFHKGKWYFDGDTIPDEAVPAAKEAGVELSGLDQLELPFTPQPEPDEGTE